MASTWFLLSSLGLGQESEWVYYLEKAPFFSLSIKPSTKAPHNDFNIGLS